jgi:hypothetical protein
MTVPLDAMITVPPTTEATCSSAYLSDSEKGVSLEEYAVSTPTNCSPTSTGLLIVLSRRWLKLVGDLGDVQDRMGIQRSSPIGRTPASDSLSDAEGQAVKQPVRVSRCCRTFQGIVVNLVPVQRKYSCWCELSKILGGNCERGRSRRNGSQIPRARNQQRRLSGVCSDLFEERIGWFGTMRHSPIAHEGPSVDSRLRCRCCDVRIHTDEGVYDQRIVRRCRRISNASSADSLGRYGRSDVSA